MDKHRNEKYKHSQSGMKPLPMQVNKCMGFLYTRQHTLSHLQTHLRTHASAHSMTNTDADTDAESTFISKHRQSAT